MKISFFNAKELEKNLKATVHKSGKLGFNGDAIKILELDNNTFILLGKGENEEENNILYMKIERGSSDIGFKLSKAGEYYYANTRGLFDKLGEDYGNKTIIYDIIDTNNIQEGEKIYKLIKREVPKKN